MSTKEATPVLNNSFDLTDAEVDARFDALVEREYPTETPEVDIEDIEEPSDSDGEIQEKNRLARLRGRLGRVAIRAQMRVYDAVEGISNHFKRRSEERQEKYERHEDDGRFTRARKFLGRNAVKIAGGTLAGVAATGYGALIAKGFIDSSAHHNLPVSHQEFTTVADVNVVTSGHTDGNGATGLMPVIKGSSLNAGQNIGIHYPAEIAPIPGETHTLEQSSQIALEQIMEQVNNNQGKNINLIGYSEGSIATLRAAKQIADANGGQLPGNIKVTILGSPLQPGTGYFNSEQAQAVAPILEQFGINVSKGQVPTDMNGVHFYGNYADIWANGNANGGSLGSLLDRGIGTGFGRTHEYTPADLADTSRQTTVRASDGSLITTINGGQAVVNGYRVRSGIGNALALNQHAPITQAQDEFFLSMYGDANGKYNAADMGTKAARALGADANTSAALGQVAGAFQPVADLVSGLTTDTVRTVGSVVNPGSVPAPTGTLQTTLNSVAHGVTGGNTGPATALAQQTFGGNTANNPVAQIANQAANVVDNVVKQVTQQAPAAVSKPAAAPAANNPVGQVMNTVNNVVKQVTQQPVAPKPVAPRAPAPAPAAPNIQSGVDAARGIAGLFGVKLP